MKTQLIVTFIALMLILCSSNNDDVLTQSILYPSFGSEIEVNIIGLSFDAMEPFLSPNGNYLIT